MFNAKHPIQVLAAPTPTVAPTRRVRPRLGLGRCTAGAALLNFLLASGCALEARPGDGIVSDGLGVTLSPTLAYDAGEVDTGLGDLSALPKCKNTPLFMEKVAPHFLKRCFECHDGTSGKALIALPMGYLKTNPETSCIIALLMGASEPPDKLQAPIITSVDPGRPDKDHEFKYEDLNEFSAYKNDVLTWLNAER